jgi:hypothetical protein
VAVALHTPAAQVEYGASAHTMPSSTFMFNM